MPLRPRHQWPGGYRAAKKAQDVASIEAAGHSRLPWEGATLAHRRPQAATYLPLAGKVRADFGIGRRDRPIGGRGARHVGLLPITSRQPAKKGNRSPAY